MGRIGFESLSDGKSRLVLEICSMVNTPIACSHRHRIKHLVKSRFIDWYRLLGVAEDAGLELIKRRYHKLALQLHPDKNKHSKAEVAFKLVSEAYSCLSDNVKRRAFNSERRKHFCIECNTIPYSNPDNNISQHSSKPKAQDPMNCSKPERSLQILREIRNRLKEEIRVIEHCLKVNRRESPLFNPSNKLNEMNHMVQRETPIFEPSEYVIHGYPHLRNDVYREDERFMLFKRGSLKGRRRGDYDSPIFGNESEKASFKGVLKNQIW
ncbi:putative Penguin [Hibiscus syriacus]|uniref:Penguin n=1 Tax=Hibiscus syriacus TaxID=106335 RepID=A0A6A2XTC1_HIBSY|nr:pre-mRNA-splicing factor cwf23-like [Hibiscus syriacus]KAE8679931.1 putative Penguin [Hibiscus syriacus]